MGMNGERERDLRRRRTGEGDLERDLESSVDGDLIKESSSYKDKEISI